MEQEPSFTTIFQSTPHVKKYLKQKYQYFSIGNPSEKAFQNSYSFVYYIQIGNHYFQQGKQAPIAIKPMLLFYGLSHWLKAALLTIDTDYPSTTQVLAHGLSTRKRKKQGYQFLSDDVRIQKDGFFPYLSEVLFHVKQLTGEKLTMRKLLFNLPEMQPILKTLVGETGLVRLNRINDDHFTILMIKLKQWNDPIQSWIRQLSSDVHNELSSQQIDEEIQLSFKPPNRNDSLLFRHGIDQHLYAPVERSLIINLPELLIHYALLYQLSMICRYEAEWWGELIYSFSADDLPIITNYLHTSQLKCPWLLHSFFLGEN
ncbi:YaaC family protein [Salipaludibacillus sp. HK11]|uniref:YaaC family protein n=1 Tax=Salipaludibacillus sp. HK11 TaxID=3394320 RepID=UPI0039FC0470